MRAGRTRTHVQIPLSQNFRSPPVVGGVGVDGGDKIPSARAVLVTEAPGWAATEPATGAGLPYRKRGEPQGRGRRRASSLPGGHQKGSQEGPLQINGK